MDNRGVINTNEEGEGLEGQWSCRVNREDLRGLVIFHSLSWGRYYYSPYHIHSKHAYEFHN